MLRTFKSKKPKTKKEKFVCPHKDYLCSKYGCPDDPNWKGDGCR